MRSLKINQSITERTFITEKYFNDISAIPMIDHHKEVELAQKIRTGDKNAEHELITANLRFVISCAKQYQNRGLSLDELIAEGNLGLIKAAQRFDETKGFKFISYAVSWVRQSILEALYKNGKLIRLPQNRIAQINKIKDLISKKIQENNGTYNVDEICSEFNMDRFTFNLLIYGSKSTSLNSTVNTDSETTFMDIIKEDILNVEDFITENTRKQQIEMALDCLNEIEKEIILLSFGLNQENREYSNGEIALKLDFSSERVRQLKVKSLKKLKLSLKEKFGSEIIF